MIEKTEWEVIDDSATNTRDSSRDPFRESRYAARNATEAMLGRWWKWKLAGVAILAVVAFAFFATIIGVASMALVALALLGAGVRKVRQWLSGDRSTSVMRT